MIELRTGVPGAGKTLFALVDVKEWAEKEKRPVFYSGIRDLSIPGWTEFGAVTNPERPWETDATTWDELPKGAIVVIDEAQRIFRPRHVGSQVPPHVAKLETHRHLGIDLVLITQHPKLLDPNVRRLVGRHVHLVRPFGISGASRYEWQEVQEDVESKAAREDAQHETRPYPRQAFAWYKSAELHTHRFHMPKKVLVLVGAVVGCAVVGFFAVRSVMGLGSHVQKAMPGASSAAGADAPSGPGSTVRSWLQAQEPRVPGLAYTAPAYDNITRPTEAPIPVMCIRSASKCRCYSQQGTRLDTGDELCARIAEKGFFVAWDQKGKQAAGAAQPGPTAVHTSAPPFASPGAPTQAAAAPTRPWLMP